MKIVCVREESDFPKTGHIYRPFFDNNVHFVGRYTLRNHTLDVCIVLPTYLFMKFLITSISVTTRDQVEKMQVELIRHYFFQMGVKVVMETMITKGVVKADGIMMMSLPVVI